VLIEGETPGCYQGKIDKSGNDVVKGVGPGGDTKAANGEKDGKVYPGECSENKLRPAECSYAAELAVNINDMMVRAKQSRGDNNR